MTSPLGSRPQELAVKDAQVKVPESFTDNLRAALSDPLFNVPDDFMTWVADQIALRGLIVPIGQVIGFTQFTAQVADPVGTAETTASTSFTDLATTGPTLSGLSNGNYLVLLGFTGHNDTASKQSIMSVSVNGAAPASDLALIGTQYDHSTMSFLVVSLTETNNTITAKYRVNGGTGTFFYRNLMALKYANL